MDRPTISLRRSLLTNLTLGVLLLGAALLLTTFLGARRAGREVAGALIQQGLNHIEDELNGFFNPVSRQLDVASGWLESGAIDPEAPAELNRVLAPLMRAHPWITSMMVADTAGREHLVLRDGESWLSRQTDPDRWGVAARWTRWSDASPEPEAYDEDFDYDVRTRPWFRGATRLDPAEDSGIHWTEPYTFATTREPGITASVLLPRGESPALVVGVDVLLADITRFTMGLKVGQRGDAFVLTDDGRFVGLPRGFAGRDPERLREALLTRPGELGGQLGKDAFNALFDGHGGKQPTRFESGGVAYWGLIRPFPLPGSSTRLLVGVVTGEAALLAELQRQRLWIAVLTVAVLALAIGRAVVSARRFSRPLEQLAQQSERISEGNFERGEPVVARITEVVRLADAQERARRGLRSLFKLERDLQLARQIQQKTFPQSLPSLASFDLAAWSQPADETGGDSYDVIGYHKASIGDRILLTTEDAERVVFLLADATGHGIGPALSVTQLRAMLRMAVRMSPDLDGVVHSVNEQLHADLPANRFITAWFAVLDPGRSTLASFSAGQAPLLLYRAATGEVERLNADTTPLGMFETLPGQASEPLPLAAGDLFAAISDGIFEASAPSGEEFEADRVAEILIEGRNRPAEEIITTLREAVEAFTEGAPPDDDRTIVLIRRL